MYRPTPETSAVLAALPSRPGQAVTPADLAARCQWSPAATSTIVRSLVDQGYAAMRRRGRLLAYWRLAGGGGA